MRIAPAFAAAVAVFALSAPALACRVGPPPVQPVVSSLGETQRLLRAAAETDATAGRREIAARNQERQAAQLDNQASVTLAQADRSFGRQRETLLASAFSLLERADEARSESQVAFREASSLRAQARDLRDQARLTAAPTPPRWHNARIARGAQI